MSEVNKCFVCFGIDLIHHLDLSALLRMFGLIHRHSIDPYWQLRLSDASSMVLNRPTGLESVVVICKSASRRFAAMGIYDRSSRETTDTAITLPQTYDNALYIGASNSDTHSRQPIDLGVELFVVRRKRSICSRRISFRYWFRLVKTCSIGMT